MLTAALLLVLSSTQDHVFPGGPDDGAAPAAPAARGCTREQGDDVTICAPKPGRFRAAPSENPYAEKPIRARMALPGGKSLDAQAVQRPVGNQGASAPALMFGLRVPLGRGKKKGGE